jgi:hypothetical protein
VSVQTSSVKEMDVVCTNFICEGDGPDYNQLKIIIFSFIQDENFKKLGDYHKLNILWQKTVVY